MASGGGMERMGMHGRAANRVPVARNLAARDIDHTIDRIPRFLARDQARAGIPHVGLVAPDLPSSETSFSSETSRGSPPRRAARGAAARLRAGARAAEPR